MTYLILVNFKVNYQNFLLNSTDILISLNFKVNYLMTLYFDLILIIFININYNFRLFHCKIHLFKESISKYYFHIRIIRIFQIKIFSL